MNRLLIVPAIAALLAGCSSLPEMPAMPSLPTFGLGDAPKPVEVAEAPTVVEPEKPLAEDASPRERVNHAVHLLSAGYADEARLQIKLALEKAPSDRAALALMEQIEGDPVAILGKEHVLYTVVAGDTLSDIAARHLGDPLKFYVLSRYNGLAAPNALRVGAAIKIPKAAADKAAAEKLTSAKVDAALAPARAATAAAPANAAKADAMRLQGLEALNKGEISRAVELLRSAATVDSSDAGIQRDLQRALRIQSSLARD